MRLAARAALGLLLWLAAAPLAAAQAPEPPDTPFLRVEAGAHTAPVNRLAVDAAQLPLPR